MFGLAEKEWVCSLSAVPFEDIVYEPFVEVAKKLTKELREVDVRKLH